MSIRRVGRRIDAINGGSALSAWTELLTWTSVLFMLFKETPDPGIVVPSYGQNLGYSKGGIPFLAWTFEVALQ